MGGPSFITFDKSCSSLEVVRVWRSLRGSLLFEAQSPVDSLNNHEDDRLPTHEPSQPILQLSFFENLTENSSKLLRQKSSELLKFKSHNLRLLYKVTYHGGSFNPSPFQ